jgi:hypothetical protein
MRRACAALTMVDWQQIINFSREDLHGTTLLSENALIHAFPANEIYYTNALLLLVL